MQSSALSDQPPCARAARRRALRVLFSAAALTPLLMPAWPARANQFTWVGGSGAFDSASNWVNAGGGNGVPGAGDTAFFTTGTTIFDGDASQSAEVIGVMDWNLEGAYTVGNDTTVTGSLQLSGSAPLTTNVLYVNGGSFLADAGSIVIENDALQVNNGGAATLNDSTTVKDNTDVAIGLDAFASLVIQGGSVLNSSQAGNFGSGVGGGYDSGGGLHHGSGSVLVTGTGSTWSDSYLISIAGPGSGATLSVQNGGMIKAPNFAISNGFSPFGTSNASGPGQVTVDGPTSSLQTTSVQYIGIGGAATLTIQNEASDENTGFTDVAQGTMSTGTFIVQSGASATAQSLTVGDAGAGTAQILTSGSCSVATLAVAAQANSTGVVTVDGLTTVVTVSGLADIGQAASGTVTVQNAGSFDALDAPVIVGDQDTGAGTFIVSGANSSASTDDLTIGNNGNGTLLIDKGGKLFTLGNATLGNGIAGGGTATLNNASGWTVNGDLTVGNQYTAAIFVQGASTLSVEGNVDIAQTGVANGSIQANASTLDFSGALFVGDSGAGTIFLSNAANLTAATLTLGHESSSEGVIAATASKVSVLGDLIVGDDGYGTLVLSNGATLSTQTMTLGRQSNGVGLLGALNSTIIVSSSPIVGAAGAGTMVLSNSTLIVSSSSGSNVATAGVRLADGLTTQIGPDGALIGTGTINCPTLVDDGGALVVGSQIPSIGTVSQAASRQRLVASPPVLTIDGDFEQDSGSLDIQIQGSDPTLYGQLDVTGDVDLAGTVLLDFGNGFAPKEGDVFEILDVDGTVNDFSSEIQYAGLAPGWQFQLQQSGDLYEILSLSNGISTTPEPAGAVVFIAITATFCRRRRG